MTDAPPNCSTCPYKPDRGIANLRCPITLGDKCGEYPSDVVEGISKITGMLCHPGARAWLMAPVIAELEHKKTECDSFPGKPYFVGKLDAFDEAITLIKNGVEKDAHH